MASKEWPDDGRTQLLVPDLNEKRTDNIAFASKEWPDDKESDINHAKKEKEKYTQEDQPTHLKDTNNLEKKENIVSSLPPDPELKHAFLQALLLTNAPEMATAMVSEAKYTLHSSNDYTSYRMAVAELWIGDATSPSFVQLLKSSFVDDWTNELLRFLAMSALISGEPTPSAKVKASLCVLKQYPNTYASVCRALGSSANELDESVSSTMDKEWYRYTLEAYEVLYNEQAPVKFWPSEEGKINDTREKMRRQDQLSYEQDVQDIKKKLLQASATSPSQAAEGDILLLLPSLSPPPNLATKQAILQALVLTDTPEMATAMVNEAKVALSQSKDFRSYHVALADASFGINLQMTRLQRSFFVDEWIIELLRFLAMCVLISGEPTPGDKVKASWCALKQYPTTYTSVCRALGSSSAIEVNQTMSSKIGKEWYLFTLEAYEVLYKEPAPSAFWSSEDNTTGDAQLKTSRQGQPSFTQDAQASNKLVRASAALLQSKTTEDGRSVSWTSKNIKKSEDRVEEEARDTNHFDDASRRPSYRDNVHYYSKKPRDIEYIHGALRQSSDTEHHVHDTSTRPRIKEHVNDASRRPRGTEHVHASRHSRNTEHANASRRPRGAKHASRRPRVIERVHDAFIANANQFIDESIAFAHDITSDFFGRCSEESLTCSLSRSASWSESMSSMPSDDGSFEERLESNALSNMFPTDMLHQTGALHDGRYESGAENDRRSSRNLNPFRALRRRKKSEQLLKRNARREEYFDDYNDYLDHKTSALASF